MTEETVSATTTISKSAETVFAVLADPSQHAAIDGTGWVRQSPYDQRLTGSGQIFRMAMYHPNHPDGSYEMANVSRSIREETLAETTSWAEDGPGQSVLALNLSGPPMAAGSWPRERQRLRPGG